MLQRVLAASFAFESKALVQEPEHPEGDAVEDGVFDVVLYGVGFCRVEGNNVPTRVVLLCIVKAFFVNQTWCNEIIFGYMVDVLYICSQK